MQKKMLAILLSLLMLLGMFPFAIAAEDDVVVADVAEDAVEPLSVEEEVLVPLSTVELKTAEDVLNLMNDPTQWASAITLANNIDLSTYEGELSQKPIGNDEKKFTGTFDGQGHEIKGVNINVETKNNNGSSCAALFGYTTNATVKNLTLYGTVSSVGTNVGAFVGYAAGTLLVENCVNYCTFNLADENAVANVGGIVGITDSACTSVEIRNCVNNADITAYRVLGGILGWLQLGSSGTTIIEGCVNNGEILSTMPVTGSDAKAGGIIGVFNASRATITIKDCVNNGAVTGKQFVGGIGGQLLGKTFNIINCCNTGTITATATAQADVGGIGGLLRAVDVKDCMNTGKIVSSAKNIGGITGRIDNTASSVVNCYTNGTIETTAASGVGSVFGSYASASLTNVYYDASLTADVNATAYSDSEFDSLNSNGLWINLAKPELALVHTTATCDNTRGYYAPLAGDNVGYHAPACHCGAEDSINTDNSTWAVCTYENGSCTVCGGLEPFNPVIDTADELLELMNKPALWDGDYTLACDIDLSDKTDACEYTQAPIGTSDVPFTGTFDGRGYTVSGISISTDGNNVGFFGAVGAGATVKNLTIDGSITGGLYVGGIAGTVGTVSLGVAATIENCHNKATVTGVGKVGGVVGYFHGVDKAVGDADSVLALCSNDGDVTATDTTQADVGGVVGVLWFVGGVRNCYAGGEVVFSARNAGGFNGRTHEFANIYYCYTDATMSPQVEGLAANVVRPFSGWPGAGVTLPTGESKGMYACYFAGDMLAEGSYSTTSGNVAYNADEHFALLNTEDAWCFRDAKPVLVTIEGHNAADARTFVSAGADGHYLACPCGNDNGELLGHEGDPCACGFTASCDHADATSAVTTPATCDAEGVRTYTCTCGEVWTETIDKDADNHANNVNYDWAVADGGYYLECSACDGNAVAQTDAPTIYVDAVAKGDTNLGDDANSGLSLDAEMLTIEAAVNRIAKTGGTVCLTDRYFITTDRTEIPAHEGKITFTSAANGGIGKTGFYFTKTGRFHLGGDTEFNNIYFYTDTATKSSTGADAYRIIVFVAHWNDLVIGKDIVSGVNAYIIAGEENLKADDSVPVEQTITLYGVHDEWENCTGDGTKFATAPEFYTNIYLGTRYNAEPKADYTVSNKNVTLNLYNFNQSSGAMYPVQIDKIHTATVSVCDSDETTNHYALMQNCKTTVNAYGDTVIDYIYTGSINTDEHSAYLDELTINLSDNACVTTRVNIINSVKTEINISNTTGDYSTYPEGHGVVGVRAENKANCFESGNAFFVSFAHTTDAETGEVTYLYNVTGEESAVVSYGSHGISTLEADGLIVRANYNALLEGKLTVNLVNECVDETVTVDPADGQPGKTVTTCTVCGDADVTELPYDCETDGHGGYVAKIDGTITCAYCNTSVDAPVASEDVPAVFALTPATAQDGKVTVNLSVDTIESGIWGATFNIVAPAGYTLDTENIDATELEKQGFSFWSGDAYLCIAKIGADTDSATEDLFANAQLQGTVLSFPYTVAEDAEGGVFKLVVTEVTRTLGDTEEDVMSASVDAEVVVAVGAEPVAGDVNGDGELTVVDALLILKALLNTAELENADITGDGALTFADVMRVLRNITK